MAVVHDCYKESNNAEQDVATNRLPGANRKRHDNSTINLETGARPQAACVSTLTLGVATRFRVTGFLQPAYTTLTTPGEHRAIFTSMNTSIVVAIALAFNSAAITHAQIATPSKPATIENSLPAGVKPNRVSPAEFKKEYASVGMPQTMHSITYLGQRDGRAYINHSSKSVVSGKWSDRVIYVDLAELEATFRDSLPKTEMKDPK
jgi:hypothetical protein